MRGWGGGRRRVRSEYVLVLILCLLLPPLPTPHTLTPPQIGCARDRFARALGIRRCTRQRTPQRRVNHSCGITPAESLLRNLPCEISPSLRIPLYPAPHTQSPHPAPPVLAHPFPSPPTPSHPNPPHPIRTHPIRTHPIPFHLKHEDLSRFRVHHLLLPEPSDPPANAQYFVRVRASRSPNPSQTSLARFLSLPSEPYHRTQPHPPSPTLSPHPQPAPAHPYPTPPHPAPSSSASPPHPVCRYHLPLDQVMPSTHSRCRCAFWNQAGSPPCLPSPPLPSPPLPSPPLVSITCAVPTPPAAPPRHPESLLSNPEPNRRTLVKPPVGCTFGFKFLKEQGGAPCYASPARSYCTPNGSGMSSRDRPTELGQRLPLRRSR